PGADSAARRARRAHLGRTRTLAQRGAWKGPVPRRSLRGYARWGSLLPFRLRSALGVHGVLDYADALDLAAHAVARLEEPGRPHEIRHPGRRAGGDDVAGEQRHRLAAVGHQLFNPEVEVGSVAVLPHLAVHLGAHPERLAPLEFVQSDEGGPGRAERVVALADEV